MVLLTYNTSTSVVLPIRDWGSSTDSSFTVYMTLVNESTNEVEVSTTISPTLDTDRRTLTFTINSTALQKDTFYLMTIYDTNASGKELAVQKVYTLPSGATATYEPVLTTTVQATDETIIIYGV